MYGYHILVYNQAGGIIAFRTGINAVYSQDRAIPVTPSHGCKGNYEQILIHCLAVIGFCQGITVTPQNLFPKIFMAMAKLITEIPHIFKEFFANLLYGH